MRIVWRGGAVTSLDVKMRVNSVSRLARGRGNASTCACSGAREGMYDDEIAAVLTREGHRSPTCEDKVLPITVQRIRYAASLGVNQPRTRWTQSVGFLSATELAAKLKIPVNWLYVQIRKQRLIVDRQSNGAYIFSDTEDVLKGICNLRNHTVSSIDIRICRPHQEGH